MKRFRIKCFVIFFGCLLFDNVYVLGQSDRKLVDSYSAVITEDNGFQWIYTAKKYKKQRKKHTCFYSVSLMNHVELKDSNGNVYYWRDGYGENCELRKTSPAINVTGLGWAICVKYGKYGWLFTYDGELIGHAPWPLSEMTNTSNPLILYTTEYDGYGYGKNKYITRLLVVSDNKIVFNDDYAKNGKGQCFETFTYNSGFYFGKIQSKMYTCEPINNIFTVISVP